MILKVCDRYGCEIKSKNNWTRDAKDDIDEQDKVLIDKILEQIKATPEWRAKTNT